jgi:uncharacterized protein
MNDKLLKVKNKVQDLLKEAEGGHDWLHIERVVRNALKIRQEEGGEEQIVYLGALLHDISDAKFNGGDLTLGGRRAGQIMKDAGIEERIAIEVKDIVNRISFAGGRKDGQSKSLELAIVQDADRLDALGAIGIARAFHYGGHKGRLIYHPNLPPQEYESAEAYYQSNAPTINHFYEKLLLLKDRMNTKTGLRIAEERHRFMEIYLENFFEEWG